MSPELLLSGAVLVTIFIAVLRHLPTDRRDEERDESGAQPLVTTPSAQPRGIDEIPVPVGLMSGASIAMDIAIEARVFHASAVKALPEEQWLNPTSLVAQSFILLGFVKELGNQRNATDFACGVAFEAVSNGFGLESEQAHEMVKQWPKLRGGPMSPLLASGRLMALTWLKGEKEEARKMFTETVLATPAS
ncbi:hypothetical protein [Aquimonas voraii]|uniref:Uncharacterized protein n=1 Tax=Aquimonas voraii TaxID=265719 RepID=A0A1G6ZPQ6_9GAMM|nr:hypothetical protein [Aquimonas voraii]SDE04511.1 hypothetical protein SAMN04488509_11519 [Aquimonas voraii]